jgi:hypothetical protein
MAGNSKDFYTCVSDMANDKANNDIVGISNFPDNEHLLAAMTEGLDLNSFVLATWMQAKKLLSEAFKEHELAKERYTKSGSHEKDFFGDGFTKDLAVYYFHLLLQQKPDAYKSVSTLLDDGVLYVAGAPAGGGHLKRLPAALEKKEKKAARQAQVQAEANIAGANAVFEPILATYLRTQSEREDRRLEEQQTRDALNQTRDAYSGYVEMGRTIDMLVSDLSEAAPGSVLYNHLESRVKECQADRQVLKDKSGRF